MHGAEGSLSLEQLLEHAGWMRALARSLASSDDEAEDLVQQTLLEAVKRPPRDPRAAGGWLARVLRNFAYRRHRDEFRRRKREERTARPDTVRVTPEKLLERLELQRQIAEEVAKLDEPYRSTIILRYFEELGVAEIAGAQGTAPDTVKTRLRRALEQLRERFDRRYGGDRAVWCAAFIALAGLAVAPAAAASAVAATAASAGAGSGIGTGAGASATAATASGVLPLLTVGGIIMTQKLVATAALAALVTLAVGVGIGRVTAPAGKEAAIERYELVPRQDFEALKARCDAAEKELAAVSAEKNALAREREDLTANIKDPGAEAAETIAKESDAKGKALSIAFGSLAELEAFKDADWNDMAAAVSELGKLLRELIERQKNGLQPDADFLSRLTKENGRLLKFAASIMGSVPTHRTGNGEFTHPLVVANLMAALLENEGQPLSDRQRAEFAAWGAEYETAYKKAQDGYGEETPEFEKVLDEIEFKRTCVDRMGESLSPDQQASLFDEETRHRMQIDLFSPMLMAIMAVQPESYGSPEQVKENVPRRMAEKYALDAEHAAQAAEYFEAWYQDIQPLLEPVSKDQALHIDPALAAGRAQLKLAKALLGMPGLSDKSRAAIIGDMTWLVPQVTKDAGGGKSAPAGSQ